MITLRLTDSQAEQLLSAGSSIEAGDWTGEPQFYDKNLEYSPSKAAAFSAAMRKLRQAIEQSGYWDKEQANAEV